MNTLVFDIETVPDVESGRRIYDINGLADADVAEVMFTQRRRETNGDSEFIRHHLQKIVAISVVLKTNDKFNVWSLGEEDANEKEIVQRFFDGVERYTPILVSWNGSGFDLPVLHYRALLTGVQAPRYWDTGNDDNSFKWNNYINRFHERHTDLMDVLAGYTFAKAPLDQIATMLGFPGKMGMSGDKVADCYFAGDLKSIRDYCETDVLNTYLVYLRFQMMRGQFTEARYEQECEVVKEFLASENKKHFSEFLSAWNS